MGKNLNPRITNRGGRSGGLQRAGRVTLAMNSRLQIAAHHCQIDAVAKIMWLRSTGARPERYAEGHASRHAPLTGHDLAPPPPCIQRARIIGEWLRTEARFLGS